MQSNDELKKDKRNDTERKPERFGGIILGTVIGVLVVTTEILKSSPADFHNTPKVIYLLILLAFGIAGAVFGDKFIEKLSQWLTWL